MSSCRYCNLGFGPTPIVDTGSIRVKVTIKDDTYPYMQVLKKRIFRTGWDEIALHPIDKCPICGRSL